MFLENVFIYYRTRFDIYKPMDGMDAVSFTSGTTRYISFFFIQRRFFSASNRAKPVESISEIEMPTPFRYKHRGTKFNLPPSHMKATGSILCIAPTESSLGDAKKADEMTEIKEHLKKLLDIEGLIFVGASMNGKTTKLNEKTSWTFQDVQ